MFGVIVYIISSFKNMKPYLLLLLLVTNITYSQHSTYTFIGNDSIRSYTNGQLKHHEDLCTKGNRTVIDSTGNMTQQARVDSCHLNGLYRTFYHKNLYPKEFGYYKNSVEDGHWLYWNIDGTLKKEEWYDKGILLKKVMHTTADSLKTIAYYLDSLNLNEKHLTVYDDPVGRLAGASIYLNDTTEVGFSFCAPKYLKTTDPHRNWPVADALKEVPCQVYLTIKGFDIRYIKSHTK